MTFARTLAAALAAAALGGAVSVAPHAAAQQRLKVHISVDMEGVGGVVTGEQLGPSGFEYGRFREFMTREALAAIDAAKRAGATEIVRMEDPVSVPSARSQKPAATAAADPPLDPPGIRSRFHGLRHTP
jgi:D-amino peptidase